MIQGTKKKRLLIKEILSSNPSALASEKNIVVKGWVRSVRKLKKFSFVVVNDGSCQNSLQVVVDDVVENYEEISKMLTGFCVSIEGELLPSQGKGQSFELKAHSVQILGEVTAEYPLQKKATSLEFLREQAHLRARTNTFGAVFRIRHELAFATHKFFHDKGFAYIHTPIVTGSDCEGAGAMFQVSSLDMEKPPRGEKGQIDYSKDFFGKRTFLTVSGQLNAECMALGLGAVYTFGPTFRAENSFTARHLAEFWMVEPEVAFADLDDVAALAQEYLVFLITWALNHCREDLEFLQSNYQKDLVETLTHVANAPFKRVTYTEAVAILEGVQKTGKKTFEFPVSWGQDLQTEHERYLTEEYFHCPVIVTDYPKDIKAFYMRLNDDGKTVRAMDVLVPGVGEIIGGSQREERYDALLKRIQEMGLPEKEYWWYLDLRRHGSAPHAGFGLGFERAVMYITGMTNIRDVSAFPRATQMAEF